MKASDLRPGVRVETPLGPGIAKYWRLAPPDYVYVEAIAVVLDARAAETGYGGSMFCAADVTIADEVQP